jgi:predicted GIY-YIG superfamily endonuclease
MTPETTSPQGSNRTAAVARASTKFCRPAYEVVPLRFQLLSAHARGLVRMARGDLWHGLEAQSSELPGCQNRELQFLQSYVTCGGMRGGWVYIMTNRPNGILYLGVTSDLARRAWEHRMGLVEGFTKRYGLKRLVYDERHEDIRSAIRRENFEAMAASLEGAADTCRQSRVDRPLRRPQVTGLRLFVAGAPRLIASKTRGWHGQAVP